MRPTAQRATVIAVVAGAIAAGGMVAVCWSICSQQ